MNKKPKVQNRSTKHDITVTEVPAACCDELAAVEFLERHRWEGHPGMPALWRYQRVPDASGWWRAREALPLALSWI